jgi:hypothetical protein
MGFTGKIPPHVLAYARLLRTKTDMSLREVATECNIAASSVQRHTSSPLCQKRRVSGTKGRKTQATDKSVPKKLGRPRKLTPRTERYLERQVNKMREEQGTFHISDLMVNTGILPSMISECSLRRNLKQKGYGYRQSRKKGIISLHDLKLRRTFAKEMVRKYPPQFWSDSVAFYLDAVTFVFKTNPFGQAQAAGGKTWRKKSQGLKRGSTAKGSKEGTGGRYVKLMVAITYGKGVLVCEPYEQMNGEYFAAFIDRHFDKMFEDAEKDSTTWIQDGDPSQNSAVAKAAMKRVGANLLKIPARSPDINPIENIFHLAGINLRKDAIQKRIEKETQDEFKNRVIQCIYDIPIETLNKTISSMDRRLRSIIVNGGGRTKY